MPAGVSVARKLLEWLFCVWIVAITARYASTTLKTLQSPFNSGKDLLLYAGWVAGCSLLLLAAYFLPAGFLRRGVLAVGATAAAAMLVLSGVGLAALVALWLLLICCGIGASILGKLGVPLDSPSEAVTLALPAGMAVVSVTVFVLNLTHLLSLFWIACVFVAGTLVLILQGARLRAVFVLRAELKGDAAIQPFVFIVFAALLNLTWAVSPEIQFDALNYHLAVPQIFLNAGGLVDLRFLHAYLSKLLEFLFAGALALGGQAAVKLFIYALGLCAATATYALGKALFDARIGMWAAALFYTTPLVSWLTGTVYTDNVIAFFTAAGLLMFVRWEQTRKAGWFPAICIVAGLTAGSKVSALFPFVVILPAMVYGLRRRWKTIVLGGCAFLLVATPTFALAWAQTGNPVFPLFNGVFKSPLWPEVNTIFNSADFGIPATLLNFPLFPFRLTLDSIRFGEALPRGALGIALMLAFPFAVFLVRKRERAVQGVAAAALVFLLLLFFTMQYGRFYVSILPAIAVLGVATAFKCAGTGNRIAYWLVPACLSIAMVMQFPALTTQYWNIPERFPVRVALGLESREDFARRALDGYTAAMYIRQTARSGEQILGVEVENLRFYLNVPLTTYPISLLDDPSRRLSGMKPGPELAVAIRQAGYTRIFARASQLKNPSDGYPYLDKAFLDSYMTLQFTDGGTSVYGFRK